jgi:hypothetical protein
VIRQVIPGGSYAECFPDGSYYCLVGNDVVRTNGEVLTNPFGADKPLHLRAHASGQFAGQGHQSGRVIRYDGTWRADGPTCGVNSVCFAPDGTLHVNDHCQHGTQGIRWIEADGTIVTGDQTYDGRGTTGLAEWTRAGNVVAGQSYVDGCVLAMEGLQQRRRLEPGHCTFVRFNRTGDRCAVALWKQQENCAVLFWFTVWEIAGLKPEPVVIDPIDPIDPPPMKLTPAQFESLKAARAALNKPVLTKEEGGAYLNRWCWEHRNDPNRPGLELDESDPKAIMPNGTPIWAGLRIIVAGEHYGGDVSGAASVGQFTPVDAVFERANATGPHGRVEPIDPGGIIIPDPDVVSPAVKAYVDAAEKRLGKALAADREMWAAFMARLSGSDGEGEGEIARIVREEVARQMPSGQTFDPSAYKVLTSVRFLGTYEGRIEKK